MKILPEKAIITISSFYSFRYQWVRGFHCCGINPKGYFFWAGELNIGAYINVPLTEQINNASNDARYFDVLHNIHYGIMADIGLSAFNKKGNGHKFGIRITSDFNNLINASNSIYGLRPYYTTTGIYYNLFNSHKFKK